MWITFLFLSQSIPVPTSCKIAPQHLGFRHPGLPGFGHLRGHGTIAAAKGNRRHYLDWPQAGWMP